MTAVGPNTERTQSAGEQHPSTPEEARWMVSVYAPEKMRKKLKGLYALLGVCIVFTLAWIAALCLYPDEFNWWRVLVLFGCYLNVIIGIVNTKRLMAGKKPF